MYGGTMARPGPRVLSAPWNGWMPKIRCLFFIHQVPQARPRGFNTMWADIWCIPGPPLNTYSITTKAMFTGAAADIGLGYGPIHILFTVRFPRGPHPLYLKGVPTYPDPGRFWATIDKWNVNPVLYRPHCHSIAHGPGGGMGDTI